MFRANVTLFEIFGLKIRVNVSWTFIAIFLAWSLAQGYFPAVYEGLSELTYWWMGVAGVVGLFGSIVLHELAHSLVARSFGMGTKSITLWLLGGIAELTDAPPSPRAEFWMAIAGPLMSLSLAILFFAAYSIATNVMGENALAVVLHYLALVNLVVAVFNLIPAFPMDGGRVLRAWIWSSSGDFDQATRKAATVGSWFGTGLIALGLINVLFSQGLHGLWWAILGMFIRFAADAELYRCETEKALKNMSVMDFMTAQPVTVPAHTNARDFLDSYVLKHHHQMYPVLDDGKLIGSINANRLGAIEPEQLRQTQVADLLDPVSNDTAMESSEPAEAALNKMQSGGRSRLLVLERGSLVGVLALKDLLRVVALRIEFGR